MIEYLLHVPRNRMAANIPSMAVVSDPFAAKCPLCALSTTCPDQMSAHLVSAHRAISYDVSRLFIGKKESNDSQRSTADIKKAAGAKNSAPTATALKPEAEAAEKPKAETPIGKEVTPGKPRTTTTEKKPVATATSTKAKRATSARKNRAMKYDEGSGDSEVGGTTRTRYEEDSDFEVGSTTRRNKAKKTPTLLVPSPTPALRTRRSCQGEMCEKPQAAAAIIQTKNYACTECDFVAEKRYDLYFHKNFVHLEKTALSCKHCDYLTFFEFNLEVHKRHLHKKVAKAEAEEKKARCKLCKDVCEDQAALTDHIVDSHLI